MIICDRLEKPSYSSKAVRFPMCGPLDVTNKIANTPSPYGTSNAAAPTSCRHEECQS